MLENDPAATLRRLDAVRRPVYRELSDHVVRVESRRPEALVDEVVRVARTALLSGGELSL